MLRSVNSLHGAKIHATDGEIGRVADFFFDDQTWTIRYLLVDLGDWKGGSVTVYISPLAIVRADWGARTVELSFSREQVNDSPGLRDEILMSRQTEARYYKHHDWPYYWTGPARWGASDTPMQAAAAAASPAPRPEVAVVETGLRSASAVTGYPVQATDGHIGRAKDFLMNDETWAIEKIEIDTTRWLPGGEVLITPAQVTRLDWSEHHIYVAMTREEIKSLPEFRSS